MNFSRSFIDQNDSITVRDFKDYSSQYKYLFRDVRRILSPTLYRGRTMKCVRESRVNKVQIDMDKGGEKDKVDTVEILFDGTE